MRLSRWTHLSTCFVFVRGLTFAIWNHRLPKIGTSLAHRYSSVIERKQSGKAHLRQTLCFENEGSKRALMRFRLHCWSNRWNTDKMRQP
ncbi:hypothetical protein HYDPIDRAFT_120374 [Hydnomerulius pinastri MD-312]|uniref:Uncharacterized protein n=1 Tax=Hydnomerulius pinastri MD-312 TaxID=994086 RepID=A0A0C9W6I3_9AGAM|nr:hypothetical protein HYDPIDRAFT_120374 [Hydnomerulius pinastri MD-312]